MSDNTFQTTVRVLYGDTDAGGIVYNANYLRYFEVGRTELMRNWVMSYSEIEKLGFVLPVTESWLRYKAPAVYDDLIHVETTIAELTKYKCKFSYRVCRYDDGNDQRPKLLVKGYTIHAAITKAGKLTKLPDSILSRMAELAGSVENT